MKFFGKFRDRIIILAKSPFVSDRCGDLLRSTCGMRGVFPVIYQFENCIADKRSSFFVNILMRRTLMVFTKLVAGRFTIE